MVEKAREKVVAVREHPSYKYPDGAREISGFGGGYEQTCRNMVIAGMEWLDKHPGSDPKFHGFEGIYGIIMEDNDDAKALSEAVVKAANQDCTGAMHQATIGHILYARKHGWSAYIEKMRKP